MTAQQTQKYNYGILSIFSLMRHSDFAGVAHELNTKQTVSLITHSLENKKPPEWSEGFFMPAQCLVENVANA